MHTRDRMTQRRVLMGADLPGLGVCNFTRRGIPLRAKDVALDAKTGEFHIDGVFEDLKIPPGAIAEVQALLKQRNAELQRYDHATLMWDAFLVWIASTVVGLMCFLLHGINVLSACLMAFSLSGKQLLAILKREDYTRTSMFTIALRVYVVGMIGLMGVVFPDPYELATGPSLAWHIFFDVVFATSAAVCWLTHDPRAVDRVGFWLAFCGICMFVIAPASAPVAGYLAWSTAASVLALVASDTHEPWRRCALVVAIDKLKQQVAAFRRWFRANVF